MSFVKSLSIKPSPSQEGYRNKLEEPDTISDTEEDEEMQHSCSSSSSDSTRAKSDEVRAKSSKSTNDLALWNYGGSGATRPNLTRTTSLLSLPSFSTKETNESDIKTKNIRQTTILIELHEAIVAIARHFEALEPKFKANLVPDYSICDGFADEDEINDLKRPRTRFRRAKALIDFKVSYLD